MLLFNEPTAETYATWHAATLENLGRRTGVDPLELHARFTGLAVQQKQTKEPTSSELTEAVSATTPRCSEFLKDLQERLRLREENRRGA